MKIIERIRFAVGLPISLLAIGLLAASYVIMGENAANKIGTLIDYLSSWSP